MKIAILSTEEHCNKIREDLLLKECFINKYCQFVDIVPWEITDFENYDAIIVKSVWGYHNNNEYFFNKLRHYKNRKGIIVNNLDIMEFLNSKLNQYNLCLKLNIPFVKTQKLNDCEQNSNYPIVLKPCISASGNNTYKVNTLEQLKNILSTKIIIDKANFYIIQPFIKGIENGEKSYIFINGKFKYAVNRFPGVFTDKRKIEILNTEDVDNRVISYGSKIFNYFNKNITHFRLDIVYQNNHPIIMEIETIDPDLFVRNIVDTNFQDEIITTLSSTIIEKIRNDSFNK